MALTIQERLKDLRVERGLTLEQLAEKTHLSKSALGSYEGDEETSKQFQALAKKMQELNYKRQKGCYRKATPLFASSTL